MEAIDHENTHIDEAHFEDALFSSLDMVDQTIKEAYHLATMSPRTDNLFKEVLLACALAATDQLGFFTPSAVREPMSKIMGERYDIPSFAKHLKEFSEVKRGPILERIGLERGYRYRFIHPMMQPYVIMQGLAAGSISSEEAERIFITQHLL